MRGSTGAREECTSKADKRPIKRAGIYVGFIEVSKEFPLS
jgi:hypothetical protein